VGNLKVQAELARGQQSKPSTNIPCMLLLSCPARPAAMQTVAHQSNQHGRRTRLTHCNGGLLDTLRLGDAWALSQPIVAHDTVASFGKTAERQNFQVTGVTCHR
jgi:hypothetical protein